MYTVYALQDPRDQTVHYIGISKEVYRRYAAHLLNLGSKQTAKDAWIQSLREQGVAPIVSILEQVETRAEAKAREEHWIQHYSSLNAPLVNVAKNPNSVRPVKYSAGVTTEEQKKLDALLRENGFILSIRKRGKYYYAYAQRIQKEEVYLTPMEKLDELTKEEVLAKIKVS